MTGKAFSMRSRGREAEGGGLLIRVPAPHHSPKSPAFQSTKPRPSRRRKRIARIRRLGRRHRASTLIHKGGVAPKPHFPQCITKMITAPKPAPFQRCATGHIALCHFYRRRRSIMQTDKAESIKNQIAAEWRQRGQYPLASYERRRLYRRVKSLLEEMGDLQRNERA